MTTVSRADLEAGIRTLGDSLVTQIDIIGGDAAFTPELSFGEITNGQHPYNFDDLHMSVTGHVTGVPDAIRKKFQTKFRRNNKPSWGYYRRNKDVAFDVALQTSVRGMGCPFAVRLSLQQGRRVRPDGTGTYGVGHRGEAVGS